MKGGIVRNVVVVVAGLLVTSSLLLSFNSGVDAFVFGTTDKLRTPTCNTLLKMGQKENEGGILDGIGNFFKELDAFVDDATARRLGNGSSFYGKRRSNFYGEKDKNKKTDRDVFDPTEDYRGPSSSGFFKWMPDENGELRPVTRMKGQNLERK